MAEIPAITAADVAELRVAAKLAAFEVDRAVFVDGLCDLDVQVLEHQAHAARARYEAAAAQLPDRKPFAGRA